MLPVGCCAFHVFRLQTTKTPRLYPGETSTFICLVNLSKTVRMSRHPRHPQFFQFRSRGVSRARTDNIPMLEKQTSDFPLPFFCVVDSEIIESEQFRDFEPPERCKWAFGSPEMFGESVLVISSEVDRSEEHT